MGILLVVVSQRGNITKFLDELTKKPLMLKYVTGSMIHVNRVRYWVYTFDYCICKLYYLMLLSWNKQNGIVFSVYIYI